jgi:hypothetical protein
MYLEVNERKTIKFFKLKLQSVVKQIIKINFERYEKNILNIFCYLVYNITTLPFYFHPIQAIFFYVTRINVFTFVAI